MTSWLVGTVELASAVGATGGTLSMFVTLIEVISEMLPAASVPRNCAEPLSSKTRASV